MEKFSIQHSKKYREIYSAELQYFLVELHERFNAARLLLLQKRKLQQESFDQGILPRFLDETKEVRQGDWVCSPLPKPLEDRRVEITGPVDRKMIVNAMNSGANCFMADFEDSNSPVWENVMDGQVNLRDLNERNIDFEINGKKYVLNEKIATLLVRPRGLHLNEKHILINGEEASGSLIDFGIFFFLNAKKQIRNGHGPYFYLPKLESYKESSWWNDVFVFSQNYLDIPQGTIKATVLIETITASFQMDEIIYSLKEHMAGLNCGRWDYIFSFIKKFRKLPAFILPDRDQVTMATHFMNSYSRLLVKTCHKRGVSAMGGMAAQIPVKNDEEANNAAYQKVKADKEREVENGHDGTWVAHPALVAVAKEVFDAGMPTSNQIFNKKEAYEISENDLLIVPSGTITEAGVRKNINVGILYIESWLMGVGAAAIYNLMEDAATAEISRTQLWQVFHSQKPLEGGLYLTKENYLKWQDEELYKIKDYVGNERFDNGKFELATKLLRDMVFEEDFEDFLTLRAYEFI
ncbi:malate synthase A [Elizabethkingia meningoseptica]|uniref:malate synthase A n=1 Tax=Elizabethkingia meningoseptica TaxID=238 RepID=UPI000332C0BE|nr:malate synthase A [Elizabethkingia meningoseptica]AQX03798.1 malate synthase A [Elizabethkingia meningoseptica]AQX45837.1 malate synthase A [Elizabethkingia meningoseptica]EOR30115.1 malate synthase [Elizabethkingia meningoseptica ATCC 13253 = NBRC 12535]KUY15130.1 malate synthase [Elizabethkingia meningoseptica]MDE5488586.1 malate synthase A [Elizabethkingia meningoseptica]